MTTFKQVQLKIADIIILVSTHEDAILFKIPISLRRFVTNKNEHANVVINFSIGIPSKFSNCNIIFSANKDIGNQYNDLSPYNWNICSTNETKFIKLSSITNRRYPDIVAFKNENADKWTVYIDNNEFIKKNMEIDPFMYPLGSLILYYIISFNDGLMIHAAGVNDNMLGYVFSGHSGFGKSTISKIWKQENAIIINDDRLIIRKKFDKFMVYNTPMNYYDDSKTVILNKIFLIKHSKNNYLKRITGSQAIAKLMSNCIQHNYDKKLIASLLDLCSEICLSIPIFEFGFIPDNRIIHFIRNHDIE